ncbi:hypothetical protein [Aerococcus sp. UMB8623]|uniref:hypothetical protein n=1 Tax=Aerococcus sp. UMB8623 TaxID=3046348 RepID=UPI0025516543|nr:hypothetical protein [Aerococcus sp. UMB8623]MDK6685811.1 hypothetical protein [Aerococcus sp. UMB8623]
MSKIIQIDGRDVKLATNGATAILYKKEFGRDFFSDLLILIKSLSGAYTATEEQQNLNLNDLTYEELSHLDLTVLYRLVYIMAKTANPDLPDLMTWLASFEEFPVADILPDTLENLYGLLQRSKKSRTIGMQGMNY